MLNLTETNFILRNSKLNPKITEYRKYDINLKTFKKKFNIFKEMMWNIGTLLFFTKFSGASEKDNVVSHCQKAKHIRVKFRRA